MQEDLRVKSKVVLMGDGFVGKTSLIRRYVLDQFSDTYIQTIGSKVTKKEILVRTPDKRYIRNIMMIWDIWGQKEYLEQSVAQYCNYKPQAQYFLGAKGALAVCDLTRRGTLQSLNEWIKTLFGIVGPVPLVILANKCDLDDETTYGMEEVAALARKYHSPAMLTSAKTGENVELAFQTVSGKLVQNTIRETEGLRAIRAPGRVRRQLPE